MAESSYRLDYAKTNRGACRGPVCKEAGTHIAKGNLKIGPWISAGDNAWYAWRHWGCTTPRQLANIQKKIEGDFELLDGYEDLNEEDQAKVRLAIENGHIADEDCVGMDPKLNRPGAEEEERNRVKEAKKEAKRAEREAAKTAKKAEDQAAKDAKKAERQAAKEAERAEKKAAKDAEKATKMAAKDAEKAKKAPVKKSAADAEDAEVKAEQVKTEPTTQKRRVKAGADYEKEIKPKRVKLEQDEASAAEVPPPTRNRGKKAPFVKKEGDDEPAPASAPEEKSAKTEVQPPKRNRGKKTDAVKEDDGNGPAPAAAPRKKSVKTKATNGDANGVEATQAPNSNTESATTRRSSRRNKAS